MKAKKAEAGDRSLEEYGDYLRLLPWLPLSGPHLLPSEEDWLPERWREMAIEMMAAPYGDERTAVVLGRSGGPAYRRSELLRLVHLTGIAATVTHLPPAD